MKDSRASSSFKIANILSESPFVLNLAEAVKRPSLLFGLIIAAAAISSLVGISLSYSDPSVVSENYATGSRLAIGMAIISDSLTLAFPEDIATFAFSFIALLCFCALPSGHAKSISVAVLSAVFAFFSVVGRYFSAPAVGMDVYALMKVLLCYIGFLGLLYPIIAMLRYALLVRANWDSLPRKGKWVNYAFEARPFVIPFLLILICWLPYIVLCFPGTTDPNDVLDQLQQYHGIYSRTASWVNFDDDSWLYLNNNNPFFSTLVTNLFFDFGAFVGSQNVGMFLLVAIQTLLLVSSFACSFVLMKRFSIPIVVRLIALATYAVAPVFPGYAICITKDTLFSVFVVYYIILLIILITNSDAFREHKLLFIAFFASALLMSLMRNNGVYMLALSAPLLFFVKDKICKIAGVVGCSALALYLAYSSILLPLLGVEGGSVKEMLSVPFQQTARYVANYPDEVTVSEREAIDQILDFDNLASNYNPGLSDDVKETYKKGSTKQDLIDYFKAWAEMGTKHPETYLAATMANCYAYFYPGASTGWIWTQLNRYGQFDAQDAGPAYQESGFTISQNQDFRPYQIALSKWYEIANKSPLGLTTNMGLCAWAVVFSSVMLVGRKKMKEIIPFMPILVLLLVCVLSPQNGNPRYALPLICVTPILLVFLLKREHFLCALDTPSPQKGGSDSSIKTPIAGNESTRQQGIKYILVGGASAVIELAVFQVLLLASNSIPISNVSAVVLSTCFNFIVNRAVTFRSSSNLIRSALLYTALLTFNTILSTWVISLLSGVGVPPILAKIIMMAVIVLWNFVLYRKVVFK